MSDAVDEAQVVLSDETQSSVEMASRINITEEQCAEWKAELEKLEAQQAETAESIAQIRRALASVEELEAIVNGHLVATTKVATASSDETRTQGESDVALSDAIPAVVKRFGRPMTPAMIRDRLKDVGYTKEHAASYFYTAIRRSVDKKVLSKTKNGRYTYSGHGKNGVDHAS